MASPNSDVAQGVGQDRPVQDMTKEYDARHGQYDGAASEGGKPTEAGSGPLPNTPNPMQLTGGGGA